MPCTMTANSQARPSSRRVKLTPSVGSQAMDQRTGSPPATAGNRATRHSKPARDANQASAAAAFRAREGRKIAIMAATKGAPNGTSSNKVWGMRGGGPVAKVLDQTTVKNRRLENHRLICGHPPQASHDSVISPKAAGRVPPLAAPQCRWRSPGGDDHGADRQEALLRRYSPARTWKRSWTENARGGPSRPWPGRTVGRPDGDVLGRLEDGDIGRGAAAAFAEGLARFQGEGSGGSRSSSQVGVGMSR
ncbi:hypothetical protein D3C72_405280 [compost metagenome]